MAALATPLDEARCWQALCQRDPAAETAFVYGVLSTGIYCRPTCTARRPRRENARFFSTPAAASTAGFRPCKRCRPDEPPKAEREAALVTAACRWLEEAPEPPGLQTLAQRAGLSSHHFHRLFKRLVGVTPCRYAQNQRARRLRDHLADSPTVTQALYQSGYNTSSRAYAEAGHTLGMSPGRYRAGGAGETIRYGVASCPLGHLLAAATSQGICMVQLGDDPTALEEILRQHFPQATLEAGDTQLQHWLSTLLDSLEKPGATTSLPLDIQGSAFQIRVWEALRQIPPGETASYGDIARRIAQPSAIRAVARACASNPVALLIPCHRVVRADGSPGGYRWGEGRKQRLLAQERDANQEDDSHEP